MLSFFKKSNSGIRGQLNKLFLLSSLFYLLDAADAGPIAYGICVTGCETAMSLGWFAASIASGGGGFAFGPIVELAAAMGCPYACTPALLAPSP